MMSLYEFLGRAAGPALGSAVRNIAYHEKANVDKRYEEVVDSLYKNKVSLYSPSFLTSVLTDAGLIKTEFQIKYNIDPDLCQ